ncbi:antitoxin [Methylomonas sp. CM2]|uniref:antitoxin n=1 Tax=Methylomonas sp. CM2 TaxID=3417647 RepID=UPI003CEAAE11
MTYARIFQSGNSQAVRLPKEFRFNLKRAVGVYCGPFVLSNVKAWTARNTLTKRVNEKSRAPFDKLRTNGIFHHQTALFRFNADRVEIFRRGDEIVLRETPINAAAIFDALSALPEDFMAEGRDDSQPQAREAF